MPDPTHPSDQDPELHVTWHDEPDDEPDEVTADVIDAYEESDHAQLADTKPLRPINWRTLTAAEAATEWRYLDAWVSWLRGEFGLPASIIPPCWHRHPELVWELSALHLRWLSCYDPAQDASAPGAFMVDFAAARVRLQDWVAIAGTRLDYDRPTRQTTWPGEAPAPETTETHITDRQADFDQFVADDVNRRRIAETAFLGDRPSPRDGGTQ